ncbi:MAG: hypothetical protein R6U27_07960 [Desulfobacterales bacterium]
MKIKKCRACGKEFVPALYKQSAEYCNDPECRKKKITISRKQYKYKVVKEFEDHSAQKEDRRLSKIKKNSGRVCRKCGKDPYPNYFYCPICHKSVRLDDEYEELEYFT